MRSRASMNPSHLRPRRRRMRRRLRPSPPTRSEKESAMQDLNRRRVLRGMLNGGAVTVGLPLLNCFLNGNGSAMADGTAMPVRFGTWYWGMGISKAVFVPKQAGANYELPEEIESLKDI